MAEELQESKTETEPAPKVVTIKRVQIGINVIIQLVVVAFIVGMVNYVSFHNYRRWDFSRNQKYALSEHTRQVLAGLKKPVKAVVFFSGASEVYGDAVALLREYEYVGKTKFQTETVDPYRNFSRARELQTQYKFGANENVVILDYDGKNKFVNAGDMAEIDQSGMMFGQPPTVKAFKGEQAITSALLEITEEKQSKLFFLAGHGEPDLNPGLLPGGQPAAESLKALRTFIERQNIKAETLKLADVDKVPDDARALLIIAPQYDLSEREMKLLREYWDRKGRFFISLDPAHPLPRLMAFLEDNAIRVQDDRVLRLVKMGPVTGIMRDVAVVMKPGSPVTKRLAGIDTQFLGQTSSIRVQQEKTRPLGLKVTSLMEAGEGFYGETDFRGGEGSPVSEGKTDHAAPLTLAVSVEKGALEDSRVSVETARMIVVGNGEFLKDEALTESGLDFTLAGFNWLINREELIGVTPKEKKTFTLNLREDHMAKILLVVMFFVPGIVAVIGVFSWWQRRR